MKEDPMSVFVGGHWAPCPKCGEDRNDAKEVHVCYAQRDYLAKRLAEIKAKQAAQQK